MKILERKKKNWKKNWKAKDNRECKQSGGSELSEGDQKKCLQIKKCYLKVIMSEK